MAIGETTANLVGYLGKATRWGREIWAPLESNGGVPVNIQDQHSRAFDLHFAKQVVETTLAVAATPGDTALTLTSATSFANDLTINVTDGVSYPFFGIQVGAPSGNIITLDRPVDHAIISGTPVYAGSHHLEVNGSVTPQIFQVGPIGTTYEVDVTRILGYIQDDVVMDDVKFGGITRLTNGVQLRKNNDAFENLWNMKSNGEIALHCFDAQYTDKAPAGSYGYRFRNTFAGQDKHGVTLRLEAGDILEVMVQDDLTGLEQFLMMAQGHLVTD
jgi:hypothetical protein